MQLLDLLSDQNQEKGKTNLFRKGFFETFNGSLPIQISSVWLQTLSKRVSGDPQHFIFRR